MIQKNDIFWTKFPNFPPIHFSLSKGGRKKIPYFHSALKKVLWCSFILDLKQGDLCNKYHLSEENSFLKVFSPNLPPDRLLDVISLSKPNKYDLQIAITDKELL